MGGAVAAAAAAEARRRQQEEEEHMTHYSEADLKENWEFKIVRSTMGAFRKPETLRRLIAEESRAGWVLVEKFDDARVRFKRPISAREGDTALPPEVDPYRSTYGISEGALAALIIAGIFGLIALVGLIGLVVALGA